MRRPAGLIYFAGDFVRPIAETLRKPFWLSLIIVVSLTIFGLIWLLTAGAREIVAAHARVDGSLQKLVGRGAVKGPHDLERIQELAGQYRSLQAKIWAEVWQPQKDLMTWPDAVENRTLFKQMLYARRIQAFRGSIGDGTFPKKLAANQYRGTIKRARADYIVVARPGQPDTVFRNTPSLIVTLKQADKEQRRRFSALEEGDQVLLTYEEGKFFGDELTDREKETYCDSYKRSSARFSSCSIPFAPTGKG